MKHYLVTATVVAALALAGCEKDETNSEPVAARFTAGIAGQGLSRAAGTAWTSGDQIGVTGTSGSKAYLNIMYDAAESASEAGFTVVDKAKAIYFQDANEVEFKAYYPFAGTEETAATAVSKTIGTNDQTPAGQPDIDFLYGTGTGSKAAPTVAFTFTHRMSKLTLTFLAGADTKLSDMTGYTVKGLKMEGTFDPATGIATADASASATDLTMTTSGITGDSYTSSLILFPQGAAANSVKVEVTLGGQVFTAPLAITDNELEASNNYTFNVTVNKTGLSITPAKIEDWGNKGKTDVPAEM